jgi:hypothetical protein
LLGEAAERRLRELADEADDAYVYLLHLALVRQARQIGPSAATAAIRNSVRRLPELAATGAAAYEQYRADGDRGTLDLAVAAYEQAETLAVNGLPDRSAVLSNLGLVLLDRHDATGAEADLQRSLAVLEEAVSSAPDPGSRRAAVINRVSALVTVATGNRDAAALSRAVELLDSAELRADDEAVLACRGRARLEEFRLTRDPAVLDEAVRALEQAARFNAEPKPLPERAARSDAEAGLDDGAEEARRLTNLGVALSERGRPADLDRAVEVLSTAIALGPGGSPERPARHANLGAALAERFVAGGRPSDLDDAVSAMETALRDTPADSPDHPDWQVNLALVLRDRYVRDGELADLERARELLETGTGLDADQLAVTLRMRWQRRGHPADLRRAIELHEAAITEPGPDPVVVRNNAGGTYRAQWTATGDREALDKALDAYRAALAAVTAPSPDALANLSMGLLNRYTVTGDALDLADAVATARQAADATEPISADRPGRLLTVANALRYRHDRDGDAVDEREAEAAYRAAIAGAEPVAAEVWLRSASAHGDWSAERGRWQAAAEAYDAAVTAADRLLRRQLSPADVAAWLRAMRTLPPSAALAHARLGDNATAAARLEWGRARLLADALGRDRADLSALTEKAPATAARYRAAAARVRSLEIRSRGRAAGA